MSTFENTTDDHSNSGAAFTRDSKIPRRASKVGRFLLHLLEMLLAMQAGMVLFHLLFSLIPTSSKYATALEAGTDLHSIAMMVFMTVPMLGWMVVRGHGWRHALEMGFAMIAPVATVSLLCQIGVADYLPWLLQASGPAMFLGMITAMLYRFNHYTVKAGHSVHATHP